jgi:signal transduction histidine kinase
LNRTEQNLGLSGIGSIANQYEDMDNLLKTANFSATMLLTLINDLLDLAKMENSSFNLN